MVFLLNTEVIIRKINFVCKISIVIITFIIYYNISF